MRTLQEVFNKIQEKKTEQKNIRKMYRDALTASGEYKELTDKIEELRIKKKKLEADAWDEVGNREAYETASLDIKADKEMLTDIAISTLMSGETVKVVDSDDLEYEPKYAVTFIKTNVVSQAINL